MIRTLCLAALRTFPFFQNMFRKDERSVGAESAGPGGKKDPAAREKGKKRTKTKIFEAYCTDLDTKGADGQLDNVIGHDEEILPGSADSGTAGRKTTPA